MRSLEIAALELKRLLSARPFRLAVYVVCLVPLLYGGLWLWAFWNPYERLDQLPVAVVNADRPVSVDGTTLSAGADLAKSLGASHSLAWHVVSAAQARRGLEQGEYYMALTIPSDFSARLSRADSASPRPGVLTVSANESRNLLASQIGERVFVEVRTAVARVTTGRYLDRIFLGVGRARIAMGDAASGAARLTAALESAATGSRELASGIGAARSGASALSAGLGDLDRGATKLGDGAAAAAGGAGKLAAGVSRASAGAATVAAGSRDLASGAGSLASGLSQLSSLGARLTDGAATVSAGAAGVSVGASSMAEKTAAAASASGTLSGGAAQVVQSLQAYASSHPEAAEDASFQAALAAAAGVSAGLAQLSSELTGAATPAGQLAAGAHGLAAGATALQSNAAAYVAGVGTAAGGAADVSAGADRLSSGAGSLAGGLETARSGAASLAGGTQAVSAGSRSLAAGTAEARSGSLTLAAGLGRLRDGGARLSDGLGRATAGGGTLAAGLRAGAEQLPLLTPAGRHARAEMMSAPVTLATHRVHPVPNYGTGFAPYFIPLALWIGALMAYFLVRPLGGRALSSTLPSPHVVLSGLWPAAAVAALQATLLLAVVRFALHLNPVRPLAFIAFTLLAAFTFTAILQLLAAAFGTAGKFVAVVLLMLQLTSAAGTFPLEVVPHFFRAINPLLPMTYVVTGLRQAISGGDLTALAANAAVLLAFAAGAIGLTMLVAHRRRAWTMDRLKPVLTL